VVQRACSPAARRSCSLGLRSRGALCDNEACHSLHDPRRRPEPFCLPFRPASKLSSSVAIAFPEQSRQCLESSEGAVCCFPRPICLHFTSFGLVCWTYRSSISRRKHREPDLYCLQIFLRRIGRAPRRLVAPSWPNRSRGERCG
jgi:hypothetical protein